MVALSNEPSTLRSRALVACLAAWMAGCHTPLRFAAADVYRLAPLVDGHTKSVELRPVEPLGAGPVRIRARDQLVLRVWTGSRHRTLELRIIPAQMRYTFAGMRFPDRAAPAARTTPMPVRGLFIRYLDVESFTTVAELESQETSTTYASLGIGFGVAGLLGLLVLAILAAPVGR